jgi:hypothetical protein
MIRRDAQHVQRFAQCDSHSAALRGGWRQCVNQYLGEVSRRHRNRAAALWADGMPRFLCIVVTVMLSAASAPAWAADEMTRPAGAADSVRHDDPLAAVPLESLTATRERPLFSPSRRPPPPPASPVVQIPAPPPPLPDAPRVVLVGIVLDSDRARAILRVGSDDKVMRVGIGDDVGGWKVSQIEGQRLVVSLGDRSVTFTLFKRDGARQPTTIASPSWQTTNQAQQPEPAPARRRHR